MFLYLIVGGTGQGKSRYARRMLTMPKMLNSDCFVFDVNNEYGDYIDVFDKKSSKWITVPSLGLNPDTTQFRSRLTKIPGREFNEDTFIDIALTKENCNIVFEEATIFLQGRIGTKVRDIVVGKRHDKNNIIMIFHALSDIPPFLIKMANWIILFKTGDSEKQVRLKHENLLEPFLEQRKNPKEGDPVIIKWVS